MHLGKCSGRVSTFCFATFPVWKIHDLPVISSGWLGGRLESGPLPETATGYRSNRALHVPTDSARAPHDDQQINIALKDRSGLEYWPPLRWCEAAVDEMNRLRDTYTGCSIVFLKTQGNWRKTDVLKIQEKYLIPVIFEPSELCDIAATVDLKQRPYAFSQAID